jgi:SPP1 family predicted phage head-tail adaptor
MRSGDLNRRVTIERVTDMEDGQGGQTQDWQSIGALWVKATPIAGKESILAGTLHQTQPWRLECRFSADLTTKDRFAADWLPDGYRINIESLSDPDGKRSSLLIMGTAAQAFDQWPV